MSDIAQTPRKFTFDVEFDGGRSGGGANGGPYRRLHSAEDVERLVTAARAEGEAAAMQRIEAQTANALSNMAAAAQAALPTLAQAAHAHREGAAELALACGRQIADAACERFPEAPLQAALASLAREIEATPKLLFRCNPALLEPLTAALNETAEAIGFPGQIVARPDPLIPRAGFVLDWGDGSAAFDPAGAAARVAAALESALAAEGLHAEALALTPSTSET
jgi:flagellar assembly protein FliH